MFRSHIKIIQNKELSVGHGNAGSFLSCSWRICVRWHHYTTLSPARMLSHFMSMTPEWGPYNLANVPFTSFRNGIRVKIIRLFIPCHDDVWKIGDIAPRILDIGTLLRCVQFHFRAALPLRKRTWIRRIIYCVSPIANLDVLTKRNVHIRTRTQIIEVLCYD